MRESLESQRFMEVDLVLIVPARATKDGCQADIARSDVGIATSRIPCDNGRLLSTILAVTH